MQIVIAGGSGLLGRALTGRLRDAGHTTTVLSRHPRRAGEVAWTPDEPTGAWRATLDQADVVVNLVGESIGGGRWTQARKQAIRGSRVRATRTLVQAIRQARRTPAAFISGSAIGIYGPHDAAPVAEDTPPGHDFLASVCREWEGEALEVAGATRVVLLRSGLVLARDGGALPPIARPFQFLAGGPLGSGRQYWSWIHLQDWVSMVTWALSAHAVSGPLNLTAPHPVTNREFAQTLGRVLHRPALLPAPAFALRLLLGEMADPLMLTGARVLPAKALAHEFQFAFPRLEEALRDLYSNEPVAP
jgi:uncharacterized protein (TIGR01777 family)